MAVGTVGAYDPAADRWTPWTRTGTELATTGWDYGLGSRDGVGQFVAAALDPTAGAWRASDWPLEPPGREGTASVWTGSELLAFVWSSTGCDGAIDCTLLVGWDPAEDRWRVAGALPGGGYRDPAWVDGVLLVVTMDGLLIEVDPADAATRATPEPPADVSTSGLVAGPDEVVVGIEMHGQPARYDPGVRTWTLLPPLPGAPADRRAVAWTSEGLTVWGGVADLSLDGSADSAEGWTYVP